MAGVEYTLLFEWTPTQVRLTRVDTGTTTGWVNNTDWGSGRGSRPATADGFHYVLTTMTTGIAHATGFAIADAA